MQEYSKKVWQICFIVLSKLLENAGMRWLHLKYTCSPYMQNESGLVGITRKWRKQLKITCPVNRSVPEAMGMKRHRFDETSEIVVLGTKSAFEHFPGAWIAPATKDLLENAMITPTKELPLSMRRESGPNEDAVFNGLRSLNVSFQVKVQFLRLLVLHRIAGSENV